ncbi:MAG: acylphosphatase [Brachybacterium sp.]
MNDAAADGIESVRRIVRVRGRVQGVGFRMDAASAASRLGVGGTVRNLLDGTVEADVEGPPEAVESLIEHLRKGPSSARVDGIDVHREAPRGADSFRVTG